MAQVPAWMRCIRNCSDDYRPVRADLVGIGLVIESGLNGYNDTIVQLCRKWKYRVETVRKIGNQQ